MDFPASSEPIEPGLSGPERACLDAFRAAVARAYRDDFGVRDASRADKVAGHWFDYRQHGFRFEEAFPAGPARPPKSRFLDLASGMGSAVLLGLHNGLEGFGIEPDADKLALTRRRIEAGGMPDAWKGRFPRAVGEHLPFKDGSFDAVLSHQTLEHVSDPAKVLGEILRVLRHGGVLHLRCPDYRGTFEGHYLLPWLPRMPRPLARAYLRLAGRPAAGLEGIRYVTRPGIEKMLREEAGRVPGLRIGIENLEKDRYRARLREKNLPGWKGPSLPWRILFHARRLFRTELQVNLRVTVFRATE